MWRMACRRRFGCRMWLLEPLRQYLAQVGYHLEQPTLVQVGSAAAMRNMTTQALAEVANAPDAGWAALFLGEGFDRWTGRTASST